MWYMSISNDENWLCSLQIIGNIKKTRSVIVKVAVISTKTALWIIVCLCVCIYLGEQKPMELV